MLNNVATFLDLRYHVYYSANDHVFYRRTFKTKKSAINFIKTLRGTIYHVSDTINV